MFRHSLYQNNPEIILVNFRCNFKVWIFKKNHGKPIKPNDGNINSSRKSTGVPELPMQHHELKVIATILTSMNWQSCGWMRVYIQCGQLNVTCGNVRNVAGMNGKWGWLRKHSVPIGWPLGALSWHAPPMVVAPIDLIKIISHLSLLVLVNGELDPWRLMIFSSLVAASCRQTLLDYVMPGSLSSQPGRSASASTNDEHFVAFAVSHHSVLHYTYQKVLVNVWRTMCTAIIWKSTKCET